VLRAGLAALLQDDPDFTIVGEAGDGSDALQMAETLQPDVVLMDISMPGMGGIEATRRLHEISPDIKVLILTVHEDKELLQEAIRSGAAGYILKRAVKAELIGAIHAVAKGDMYVHPAMMRALITSVQVSTTARHPAHEALTSREEEVLRWIARGYTNAQIGDKLNISVRTVEYHRANIMDKLNLKSRVGLVRYAQEHGLLSAEEE
jgi:two-component system response regulator NreC